MVIGEQYVPKYRKKHLYYPTTFQKMNSFQQIIFYYIQKIALTQTRALATTDKKSALLPNN